MADEANSSEKMVNTYKIVGRHNPENSGVNPSLNNAFLK
jgi:hypothetical protein